MIRLTATEARKSFFELIRNANDRHEMYSVLHRHGNVVLMSETEYDSLIETLELLSTPGFRSGFYQGVAEEQAGETVSFEDVFGEPQ